MDPTISTDLFSFKDRVFCTESSTLRGRGISFGNYINLMNPKTGRCVEFRFDHNDQCGEETAGWWFVSSSVDSRIDGLKVLIIND